MRPPKYYVCYNEHGQIIGVHKGTAAAIRACGGRRSYWSFQSRMAAEEFAAWWTYEAPLRAAAWKADIDRQHAERRKRLAAVAPPPMI